MKKIKHVILASLTLHFCCAASLAAPNALTKEISSKGMQTPIPKTNVKPEQKRVSASKSNEDTDNDSTVNSFAKEYAALMKKATAALNIKKSLTSDEEKRLWTDYQAGKYSKNKVFTKYMRQAKPYHNKLRSFMHIFEEQPRVRLDFSKETSAVERRRSHK